MSIKEHFSQLPNHGSLHPMDIFSSASGEVLLSVPQDNYDTLTQKITAAARQQATWQTQPYAVRVALLKAYATALKAYADTLADIIAQDAGKTPKEARGEVDSSADVILKTIADVQYAEQGGMLRHKERPPVGVIGLITSFNFPLVVAHWNIAPALLAGNAVIWKPSEKTPLAALYAKNLFDSVAGENAALLHIALGGRDIGEALVAHESIAMVSATGSVGMGEGIKKTLAAKRNTGAPPILELGGNNAIVIGEKMDEKHLEWSLNAIMQSFLGTTGQRCTNTRRLIVHKKWFEKTVSIMEKLVGDFIASGAIADVNNAYGYHVLVDEDAYKRFESAKQNAANEGGNILFGKRIAAPEGVYRVEPALAVMPKHTAIMHTETFAPLLYITPYEGDDLTQAMVWVNAPENAGLVNGIYTQSQKEADSFVRLNEAGHGLINSPKGTGTPAYGMGFGGNKASGVGEILNSVDPLAAFTKRGPVKRIAQNKDIPLTE